jgi:precorrin-3B methylase
MLKENDPNPQQSNQVYGFLCQKTNVFYAFESYETYQQFLEWLSSQQESTDESANRGITRAEAAMIDEAEQLADF